MTTRDQSSKFHAFRAEWKVQGRKVQKQETGGPLLGPDDKEVKISLSDEALPPEWMTIVPHIETDLSVIAAQIKVLEQKQMERLKVHFEGEEGQLEQEIDVLTKHITEMLKRSELGLKRIAVIGFDNGRHPEDKTVRLNVMRHLGLQLQHQSKVFRQVQRKFLSELAHHEQLGDSFFGVPEVKVPMSEVDEPDGGLSFADQQAIQRLREIGDERHREIIKIAQSIEELASLFSELNALVIDQGTILDRIDWRLDNVKGRVRDTIPILIEPYNRAKKARPLKCILSLMLMAAILLTILILKHSSSTSGSGS